MKKLLGVLFLAVLATGCTTLNLKPITAEDSHMSEDFRKISNYERIFVTSPDIQLSIVSEDDAEDSALDIELLKAMLKEEFAKKNFTLEYIDNAPYSLIVHRLGKTNAQPGSMDNIAGGARAGQMAGSAMGGGAGAAGAIVGSVVGLAVGSMQDNRFWLIDSSLNVGDVEHTRFQFLTHSTVNKKNNHGVAVTAASEFFELK